MTRGIARSAMTVPEIARIILLPQVPAQASSA
jgi:hypothetical protein